MNIKLINRGQEGELVLEGRLDTLTAPEAEEVFNQMAERFEKIVLNMAGMEYVSSAGLRTLKRLHMAMKKKNGSLVLTNVRKMVMEVFEMTGFAGLLNFE
ncbi:MAG: STAS domain-containing protein [Clostridiales bacterium]|nr:STAS domain-containing protein [Clostridiales bacterium]